MDYLNLSSQDTDALDSLIDGENDALILDTPASEDYYYLMGWHDVKYRIDRGELQFQLVENKVKEEK